MDEAIKSEISRMKPFFHLPVCKAMKCMLSFLTIALGLIVSNVLAQNNSTASQGTIASLSYLNNCTFVNFLIGTFGFPNGTISTMTLPPALSPGNSSMVKFRDLGIPNNSSARISPTFTSLIFNPVVPISFTIDPNSLCTASLICSGSRPFYNFTLLGLECFGFNTTTSGGPTSTVSVGSSFSALPSSSAF